MLGPYKIEALVINKDHILLGCSKSIPQRVEADTYVRILSLGYGDFNLGLKRFKANEARLLNMKVADQLSRENPRLAQNLAGCEDCIPRKQNNMEMAIEFETRLSDSVTELTVLCPVLALVLRQGVNIQDAPPCITERTVEVNFDNQY